MFTTRATEIHYRHSLAAILVRFVDAHFDPSAQKVRTEADQLSATFAALADPTRRAILARLATGQASVTERAAPFDMTLAAVSKHLKVLKRAGLVSRGREAQWRPCRLDAGPLKNVDTWVERYRRFWEQWLDRLDTYSRSPGSRVRRAWA